MGYQALYRVWRPQQFIDVVGQGHVTKTLQNALVGQKVSHAYLFSGPRGTGKTSAAKILAKAVNCELAPTSEPCNECATCRGITDGSISDVIEIDAASNNGVEEIRDIRDKVKYAPNAVTYKVYIIDEVHMLSQGAFNALLKTLEEPPKHVIFILATTEPHKIPLTIISRCQRFDFKRIQPQDIVGRMSQIIDESEISCDEQALHIIARAAEGGMRDALSLLDQAISFSSETVSVEDALTVTGSVSQSFLSRLAKAIYDKEVAVALEVLDELLATTDIQLVVLGSGDYQYEEFFRGLAQRYPDKVGLCLGFIPDLARKIYAGSDMFLMPSKSEPCGLSQMVALRYGSVPIVRETGGLRDSVTDSGDNMGNGFVFSSYNAHDMLHAIKRAVEGYQDQKGWAILVKRAMESDNSWGKSANEYIRMYKEVLKG